MKKTISSLLVSVLLLSSCSLFKKDPQESVDIGTKKLGEVQRMASKFDIKGSVTMPPGEKLSSIRFNVTGEGKSDNSDMKNISVDSHYGLSVDLDGKKGNVEVDVKTLDKSLFFRITDVKIETKDGGNLGDQLKPLLAIWYKVPLQEGDALQSLNSEQQKVRDKFKNTQFFINATEDGEEQVQGMDAIRYRVDLNKNVIKDLILEFGRMTGNLVSPEEESAITASLDDIDFSGAVWVADDKAIHRMQGTVTVQPPQGATTSFDFDYTLWDLGKRFTVTAPEGAQDFNPLVMLPLIGALGSLTPPAEPEVPVEEGAAIDDPLGAAQVTQ